MLNLAQKVNFVFDSWSIALLCLPLEFSTLFFDILLQLFKILMEQNIFFEIMNAINFKSLIVILFP